MKTFVFAIVSFLAVASAAPLEARADSAVLVCTEANWGGECETIPVTWNQCAQLPSKFLKNVGSLKPSTGQFCRVTYTADTCTTHGDAFIDPTPGAPDLHHFEDPATQEVIDAGSKITSLLCQQCTGCQ
ncbi:hypothetical protein EJ04DRAFT_147953 [Polyplosphaeria fusca]|uniref:Uncharacterized protein n=1 Tax=Polyplosphaeria fusca TaxID=682080 RepID=A0A9P4QLS4_9PLEO|nr:hypothetical protein EJ04DRAFT_147953 [Polyplosphaeria fusca]